MNKNKEIYKWKPLYSKIMEMMCKLHKYKIKLKIKIKK